MTGRRGAGTPNNDNNPTIGVECGRCGGPIYFETCQQNGGPMGCEWAIASECQRCGQRHEMPAGCLDCHAPGGTP